MTLNDAINKIDNVGNDQLLSENTRNAKINSLLLITEQSYGKRQV